MANLNHVKIYDLTDTVSIRIIWREKVLMKWRKGYSLYRLPTLVKLPKSMRREEIRAIADRLEKYSQVWRVECIVKNGCYF